jgi:WD40 repeat protein/3',5'-cyclic AMP phosphodiesterase CpdA
MGLQGAQRSPVDFFVSYSPADEGWASWIAWELESAGYRTVLQAWDFVPGTNFIDFMDLGVTQARAVIAVLSRAYLKSRYGRLEWQSAIRADPDDPSRKLITVRVDDSPLEGLLATITFVNLVGVADPATARGRLLARVRQAVSGRAKPTDRPGYPAHGVTQPVGEPGPVFDDHGWAADFPHARRKPAIAPAYPLAQPTDPAARTTLSILHVAGPRFGRGLTEHGLPVGAVALQERTWAGVTQLADTGLPRPELLVISGDLTESGSMREFDQAVAFVTGLRAALGLEASRTVIIPGAHDVTRRACEAYFASCEADDVPPRPPYWPKWRHFSRAFDEFYRGLDTVVFDRLAPWTLFAVPDLRMVLAGLNSTIAESHRHEDHYGWIGEAQAAWFAERLRSYEEAGWLRVGVVRHAPTQSGQEDHPSVLRDTATLDRLLGRRLNLLLHGPGHSADIRTLDSGLLTVPASWSGQYQLLVIDPGSLTVAAAEAAGPERTPVAWHAVGGTFTRSPGADDTPGDYELPVTDSVTGRAVTPVSQLLDRMAEVVEAGHPSAKVRRVLDSTAHLLVTYPEDGFIRQWRIAAHVGEVTRMDVDAFVAMLHTGEPEAGSEFVYEGPRPPQTLRDEALRRGVRLRSFIEFQGLLDLSDYVAKQTLRLRSDPRYPPELYVPQRFRDMDHLEAAPREDLVEELLRELATSHARFVLLLGDFGRGKTYALRELARHIPSRLPHLTPIYIELRALDKAHTVDGLVAAHLANHGEEHIDLKAFRYMLRQGRIVLLFDGFDELVTRVTYDRAADHLHTLLQTVEGSAKVIVASRTQHFKSHAQVLTALGERVDLLPYRRVLDIAEFTEAQIRSYLANRYDSEEAADDRIRLLSGVRDLLGLSRNPRMLSFVADLDSERLAAVATAGPAVSAAALYQAILQAWLSYEEQRTQGTPGTPAGLRTTDMWRAVTALAMRLWDSGESFLRLADLADQLGETLIELTGGTRLSAPQSAHAVGTGSLLIRTDDGLFGFIHSSVSEWLIAREIARQITEEQDPAPLARRPLSQLTIDFLCDLAEPRRCQQWVERVLTDADSDSVVRANALKIATRLRTPARTNLRGALLQGEDLSYRDLRQVDLSGADLTEARLVGANMSGGNLTEAKLVAARLDEANLSGADLRDADLRSARLTRADLRGAHVTGSRWTRAALIDVVGGQELLAAPEFRDAAIAPGQPLLTAIAPASVCVPYGYHFEIARLPEPIAWSPSGGVVAVGCEDGGVLLADTATGLPLRILRGHHGRVYAVGYSHDGELVTAASDGTLRMWDPVTGTSAVSLTLAADGVWPLVLDREFAAAGTADGTMRLLGLRTGDVVRTMSCAPGLIYTAAFNPAGTELATGDSSGTVTVWNVDTGEAIWRFRVLGKPVYRVAFSPDGGLLACGDPSGMVWLCDADSGTPRAELSGHTARVYTLAFHPREQLLASGDVHGGVRLWDTAAGQLRKTLTGHRAGVYRVLFSPDGSLLASSDSGGSLRLWDAATGQCRHAIDAHRSAVWPPVFSPDSRQLATTSNDGTVRLWDPFTGRSRYTLRGHGRRVTSVTFSADGGTLAAGGSDGAIRVWDVASGELRHDLHGPSDLLVAAIFAPSGQLLAAPGNDGGVHLWDAATGVYQREMNVETEHVWAEAFSPGGSELAIANDDDTVRVWYLPTSRNTVTLAEHYGRVRCIAFRPDGGVIATGCDDRKVRLWDATDGTLRAELAGHTHRVYGTAFTPDGMRLASASHDGTIRMWDPDNGTEIMRMSPGSGQLWSLAFSPDGSTFAVAGGDGTLTLLDTRTGSKLAAVQAHPRRVSAVAFSPDGSMLASGGDDGTGRIWRVDASEPYLSLRLTLLGLPEGWAAFSPDGRYKSGGSTSGEFWHVIGLCRFEPGELDPYLPEIHRVPLGAPF